MRGRFRGGVHPPEQKGLAAEMSVEVMPNPVEVRLPLLQHLGAACEAAFPPRSEVEMGQVIGQSSAFVSAPVHASLSGTTGRISAVTLPAGRHVEVIPIKVSAVQPLTDRAIYDDMYGGSWPIDGLEAIDPSKIVDAARDAGLVGLGGAAFPTHVKLRRNENKPVSHMLINGAECEPYLTADYRLMVEAPEAVVCGSLLASRAAEAEKTVICIENNKPAAIKALRPAAEAAGVSLRVLKTKYPQGGERQLIAATLGRNVPLGGLPMDVGVVVLNVATAAALARAVYRGRPLTHRIVTVSGRGVRNPKNLLVPIGASFRHLIDYCGGLSDDVDTVVAGGPMMGFAVSDLDIPVTKGTSGITVLARSETGRGTSLRRDIRTGRGGRVQTACIRCGRCGDVCPMNLLPGKIAQAARVKNPQLAKRYNASACVECGCCAFECPAREPLVQLIRLGKMMARE